MRRALNDRTLRTFCYGWIDCRDTFRAVLRLVLVLVLVITGKGTACIPDQHKNWYNHSHITIQK